MISGRRWHDLPRRLNEHGIFFSLLALRIKAARAALSLETKERITIRLICRLVFFLSPK